MSMITVSVDGSVEINDDCFTKVQRDEIIKLVAELKATSITSEDTDVFELFKGKNIFVRTVSYHQIGRCLGVKDGFLLLENASWVASSGRFNEALVKGTLDEVEPFPDGIILVGIASIVDVTEWRHKLPRAVL
jgi:hypothetical protein